MMVKFTGWREAWKEIGDSMVGQAGDVQGFTSGKVRAAIIKESEQGWEENGNERKSTWDIV